jgi:hypothetical protein
MKFSGNLFFEGKNCLQFIKKDRETGWVEIVLEGDHREVVLFFEPQVFKELAELMNQFLEKGEIIKDISTGTGKIRADVSWDIEEDKKFSTRVNLDVDGEGYNIFRISKGKDVFDLVFGKDQAKEIAGPFNKVAEIERLKREAQK